MTTIAHCRHCYGDCRGECLMDTAGHCIHDGNLRPLSWPQRLRLLATRAWWRRVFWGTTSR
jgi:hypothetical protein